MMKLYIGHYWVPFPASEYGGTWLVIASDEEECEKLLRMEAGTSYKEYHDRIQKEVKSAQVFDLDPNSSHAPRVVDTFFS